MNSIPNDLEERQISNKLDTMRHSCAHVMAHAVSRLYPDAKFGIGPTTDDGFYYDMDLPVRLTPEDLAKIENEMKKIISQKSPFVRKELPINDAIKEFKALGQHFKIEIIQTLAEKGETTVSTYTEGDFVDLCRGPHLENAGQIPAFKLMTIAGAYWRGNEKNPQLQRIYGTAFETQKELDEHLHLLEEAKKRDHRKLGKELDLFSFHPEAPASPFFHPKGAAIYNRLQKLMRDLYRVYDYVEVITPQILDVDLWKKSGHYDNYQENMYFSNVDEREFAVKPMNCPTHALIYSTTKRSYRDLPIRMADFGRLHRYEKSGALHGLTRVRSFCQDDAHIFCTPDQIESEIKNTVDMIMKVYQIFGFETKIALSTRPEKRVGSDELWDKAESGLKAVLDNLKTPYSINPGDGAFYGPKIDFQVRDALKRDFQLATIQVDFNLPERFELEFTGSDNNPHRPVMVHRAVLGSIERFLGILIEHTAGAFPFWLAPIQARLIPIKDGHKEYCETFMKALRAKGFRVDCDDRNESMGLKTREAQTSKIPFALAAGDREIQGGQFAVRKYGEKDMKVMTMDEIIAMFTDLESVVTFT